MSDVFSVYDLATGHFTGLLLGGAEESVSANTPAGHGVWPGECDGNRVRVDLVAQALVAYQPPAPSDGYWQTWAWDESAWRWVATPTLAALAAQVRGERDRRLGACDWVVARSVELGEPVPAAWAAYRAALRDVPGQEGFPGEVQWPALPVA